MNKYLEKIAAFIRSPKNIGARAAQLNMAMVNRIINKKAPDSHKVYERYEKAIKKLATQPHSTHPEMKKSFKETTDKIKRLHVST